MLKYPFLQRICAGFFRPIERDTLGSPMKALFIILLPSILLADCQSLLQQCYLKEQRERSTCLDLAIRDKSCAQSDVASLIQERLSLTGINYGNGDSLSIDTIDHACIKNFDDTLSLELIKGAVGAESIASLHEKLSGCAQRASIDLFRP